MLFRSEFLIASVAAVLIAWGFEIIPTGCFHHDELNSWIRTRDESCSFIGLLTSCYASICFSDSTMYSGRPFTSLNTLPRYSPSIPRLAKPSPPKKLISTASVGQPGTSDRKNKNRKRIVSPNTRETADNRKPN